MTYILLLVTLQFFWSSSYVAMKLAMGEMPMGLVMILRYGIAGLVLLAASGWKNWRIGTRDLLLILLIGVLNFTLSPFFQLMSLQLTYATDTAVLVAFEPMTTALLAVLILKERFSKRTLIVFIMATIGVLIMSDINVKHGDVAMTTRLMGNFLFLISVCCESLYSIISRYTTQRISPLRVIALMTLSGAVTNCLIYPSTLTWENFAHIGTTGWGSILFLALFCSVVGYGGWTILAKVTPVNRLTLSLFLQPLFGGLVAYFTLDEVPNTRTLVGASIVVISLLFWVLSHLNRLMKSQAAAPHGKST
jgi:drug/metabolite transporter (DMT)-like permease